MLAQGGWGALKDKSGASGCSELEQAWIRASPDSF